MAKIGWACGIDDLVVAPAAALSVAFIPGATRVDGLRGGGAYCCAYMFYSKMFVISLPGFLAGGASVATGSGALAGCAGGF